MKNRKLNNIRFGIEIEAEFPKTEDSYELIRKHRLIRGWEMDFDGTLDNGSEYRPKNTNKLYFTKDSIDQIKEIIGLIKAHKGKIKPSCGLHIHIDMKKFTDQEIVNIVKTFIKYQNKIYRDFKVVKGRFVYAEKIPKNISNLININIIKEIKERDEMLNMNSELPDYFTERDFALNLQSLNLHNTLEFRLFNGTIQDRKIKSYIKWAIEFCLMFAKKEK